MARELLLPPLPHAFRFGAAADTRATQPFPVPAAPPRLLPRDTLPFAVPAPAPVLPFRAPARTAPPPARLTQLPQPAARPTLPFAPPVSRLGARARGLILLASTFALGVVVTLALHG